jgi:acrylyl-CoA reductase (NADPH)
MRRSSGGVSGFRAIYLERSGPSGPTLASVREVTDGDIPALDGAVLVDVAYSTLNYKDALAITGRSPVVRRFPMIPGIDLSGTITASEDAAWPTGTDVIVNGWEIGELYWGGLAQRARMKTDWLLRRPDTLSLYDTMAAGTAGYTAALAVRALERHGVEPGAGDVLVTGATGGVGSLAVMLLAASGFRVVASTGKPAEAVYLEQLGAAAVVDRGSLSAPGTPLQKERWAAAIDAVGSHTLANVCASTRYGGVVAACGLAQGMDFPATVAPFILRGVTLAGINSVLTPRSERIAAWQMIERLANRQRLRALSREVALADAIPAASELLAGRVRGRIVVDVNQ